MDRLFSGRLQRVEVFLLQFGQFPDVMPLARGEDDDQTGESRERRKPKTKHAREE